MPRVLVSKLSPGWHLASNVYNQNGLILLTAGTKLTSSYIARLRDLDVRTVDVQLARFAGLAQRDILSPELRSQAAIAMRRVADGARRLGSLDPSPLIPYVDHIVSQVTRNEHVLVGLTDIRAHDAYTHAHSVNVCMLAVMVGRSLGLGRAALVSLATGAILHDFGKVFINQAILSKQGPLSTSEFEQIKQHTVLGHKTLTTSRLIPTTAAQIALRHHERLDGSGYPHGTRGDRLSVYARIVAVADVYDAISSDRPYRLALAPVDCIRLLREGEAGRLCDKAVAALITRIAPYPEGCTVRLNTGELAVVGKCSRHAPELPEIIVFADSEASPLPEPQHIKLVDTPHTFICGIVSMDSLTNADVDAAEPTTESLSAHALPHPVHFAPTAQTAALYRLFDRSS